MENTSPRTSALVLDRLLAGEGMNKEEGKLQHIFHLDRGFSNLNLQSRSEPQDADAVERASADWG